MNSRCCSNRKSRNFARIFKTLMIGCALLPSACGGGGGGGSSAISIPTVTATPTPEVQTNPQNATLPTSPTTWTYTQSLTAAANQGAIPSSGTVQVNYQGTTTYRGSQYYVAETTGTISPSDIDVYFTWSGRFDEAAYADLINPPLPCNAPRSETLLSAPIDLTSAGSLSGQATNYQCQSVSGTSNWSLSVTAVGSTTITVPAGAFQTTEVTGVWTLGTIAKSYTEYLYGDVLIERDTTETHSGSFYASYTTKLASGPVNVAEPGPSILGSLFW